ncbi:MAG: hypothetical protein IT505_08890 [Aquabacterium sp.]|jgi:hypothetical protein|nr:hypothetical protein [Aquabacterium sp.]
MKQPLLTALIVWGLAATGPALAARNAHDHGHGASTAALQLNAGQKWATDAPLRAGVGEISRAMAASLPAIHANKMSAKAYSRLAKQVQGAVAQIVAQCKLPPAADAQLHIVIADLLVGADQMAGKVKEASRVDGAVKVIGALNAYGQHFDDPDFHAIEH